MLNKLREQGFRFYLSVATLVLVMVLIWYARDDLMQAWFLLEKVNIWWLLLLLPLQLLAYYSWGQMSMSYLEQRRQIKKLSWWEKVKYSLGTNFVDHVMPSGGISGASYAIWRLRKLGVNKTHAMMSQLVDATVGFVSIIPLLLAAVVWVSITNQANGTMVMLSVGFSVGLLLVILFGSFLVSSQKLMVSFGVFLAKTINKAVQVLSFGRYKKQVLHPKKMEEFFLALNGDYERLMKEKKVLKQPLIWGLLWTTADVLMYEVVFISMGTFVDPMVLVLARSASMAAGMLVLTPAGMGAVEATFILVLVSSGVGGEVASAGILLTRVILLVGTLATGYYFYHKGINHGKISKEFQSIRQG